MVGSSSLRVKQIPSDVVFAMLSRLPVKSLCRFKCVSKEWRALIQDPIFVDFHLEQSMEGSAKTLFTVCMSSLGQTKTLSLSYFIKIDCSTAIPGKLLEELEDDLEIPRRDSIIASCNGLVCVPRIGVNGSNHIQVCNPATCETLYLPTRDFLLPENATTMVGIGFDSVQKEYKVVCWETQIDGIVHIITLSADSWRTIDGPSIGRDRYSSRRGTVYLNGALYWYTAVGILSFDLTEEKFSYIQLPADMLSGHDYGCQISELEGQICLVDKGICDSSLRMWTLTDSSEPEWVSTQIHLPMIQNGEFLRVVPIRKGEILVDLDLVSCGRVCICRYNEDGQVTDFIHVTGIPYYLGMQYEHRYHALYVESIVSLKQYNSRSEANESMIRLIRRSVV